MGNIHIKHIPEPLHEEIRRRAALRGQSVRAFILQLLEKELGRPAWGEWLAELAAEPASTHEIHAAVAVSMARRERAGEHRRAGHR